MFVEEGSEQGFRPIFQFLDNLCHGAATAVKHTVGSFQIGNAFGREGFGMEAEGMEVKGAEADGIAGGLGTGWNVTVHLVGSTHKRVGANLIPLLDCGNTSDGRVFTYANVTTQLAPIGNYSPLRNLAVMPHVGIGHQQDVVRNPRAASPLDGSPI